MKIYDLRTEYRENPAGLAAAAPRFSWKMKTDEKNTMQDLYRIEVVSEEETVWDTGIRKSSESVLVPYEGKELRDETIYQVKITVWDNYGRADSRETFFETGIFDPMTFQAQMIIHDFPKEEMACPVFYKKVLLKGDVKKARLYATAQGVYDYEYNTKTSLKLERFSMDSTLAEIVAEPLAVQMFNKFAPGARPMFEAVVNALNAQEE